jgi:Contractile injection system tape measure protein
MEIDATLAPAGDVAGSVVFVGNAGLVLTSPFLPHLFQRLGVTTLGDDGRPRIADAQAPRAVNLLQYLATGAAAPPDAELALNKVLCGIHPSVQLPAPAPLTTTEAETCDQLLAAMIANWPAISLTSLAGLREVFLQREGRLEESEDRCRIRVQRKTLDVLVDQVPWAISVVFHGWMTKRLHVTW